MAQIEIFSNRSCFSIISAVVEAQNPDRAAKAVWVYSHLPRILPKFQYNKRTNIDFSQKFQR